MIAVDDDRLPDPSQLQTTETRASGENNRPQPESRRHALSLDVTAYTHVTGAPQRGLVDPTEAYAKAIARAEFKTLLSRGGISVGVA